MLNQQPRIFTPEESAFAAKHFAQVYSFLAENNLSEDDYYDHAVNGFLKAVQQHHTFADTDDFKRFAAAMMIAECTAYEKSLHRAPTVINFSECYENAYELEEAITDVKNTMNEAISAIAFDETMKSFDATQKRIVDLLLKGYSKMDIATMLRMSVNALFDEICLIQNKATANLLTMAA